MSSLIADVAVAACSSSCVASADAEVSRGALMVCEAAGAYRPATADEVLRQARQVLARRVRRGMVFDSPAVVKDYLKVHLSPLDYEVFMVIFVDAQHKLIACEQLFRGSLTQTSVYPREVVKRALVLNAGAVVLAHNHPSGSVEPSRADEMLTQTLKSALMLVDVRVLDHIVVAGDATVSFAEKGLL